MVHKINEEGAETVKHNPNRLGLFASLPLPHTDEAVNEAKFAINELKADGFGLSTNYAGVYLGDARYDKLMEYFDSIGAVVAVHPVKHAALPKGMNSELPIPAMEFLWTQQEHLLIWLCTTFLADTPTLSGFFRTQAHFYLFFQTE